jgi:hypothetical protein
VCAVPPRVGFLDCAAAELISEAALIFNGLNINLIDSNVTYSTSGNHFSKTALNALRHIDSEFILFFLDDMCLINKIKNENLEISNDTVKKIISSTSGGDIR